MLPSFLTKIAIDTVLKKGPSISSVLIKTGISIIGTKAAEESVKSYIKYKQKNRMLEAGDVIGVKRKTKHGVPFEHYGVYIGNDRVIHFTSKDSDIDMKNNEIMETDMNHFLRESDRFFILNCEYAHSSIKNSPITVSDIKNGSVKTMVRQADPMYDLIKNVNLFLELYTLIKKRPLNTNEETIQNARKCLGQKEYNLVVNNCEHFAIWCKTGVHQSHQVESFIKLNTKTIKTI
ncbi:lecithin retinol acyltransferase family protein [Metabacillus litoralis]|uniref:lecithin retinol acyltransferase family protein n=1 Tax=Metabacillus TaxID=2675233 RepID=UPI001BA37987|nr:lecithin retinol acyltransferase family protein [Metabacillus litoralis]UHA61444.1 lecithin retinol acyltransferase family protein [Metabacillus litoralis]